MGSIQIYCSLSINVSFCGIQMFQLLFYHYAALLIFLRQIILNLILWNVCATVFVCFLVHEWTHFCYSSFRSWVNFTSISKASSHTTASCLYEWRDVIIMLIVNTINRGSWFVIAVNLLLSVIIYLFIIYTEFLCPEISSKYSTHITTFQVLYSSYCRIHIHSYTVTCASLTPLPLADFP